MSKSVGEELFKNWLLKNKKWQVGILLIVRLSVFVLIGISVISCFWVCYWWKFVLLSGVVYFAFSYIENILAQVWADEFVASKK